LHKKVGGFNQTKNTKPQSGKKRHGQAFDLQLKATPWKKKARVGKKRRRLLKLRDQTNNETRKEQSKVNHQPGHLEGKRKTFRQGKRQIRPIPNVREHRLCPWGARGTRNTWGKKPGNDGQSRGTSPGRVTRNIMYTLLVEGGPEKSVQGDGRKQEEVCRQREKTRIGTPNQIKKPPTQTGK